MDKPTSCMQANKMCHLQVATGGKENDLKLWDGNKPEKPVFQAKNVSQNMCGKLFTLNIRYKMIGLTFECQCGSIRSVLSQPLEVNPPLQ